MTPESYYLPELTPQTERIAMADGEFHHCTRVLRRKVGDRITLVDGRGGYYAAEIAQIGKTEATVEIHEFAAEEEKLRPKFSLGIAPPKRGQRFEWCLEKLTEIGVASIFPLNLQRGEKQKLNHQRLEKVLTSAMKQAQRATLPTLHPMMKLDKLLSESATFDLKGIAMRHPESKAPDQYDLRGKDVLFLVGPEGDFTDDEWELALAAGFNPISLGLQRLRTETAAIFLAAQIHGMNLTI